MTTECLALAPGVAALSTAVRAVGAHGDSLFCDPVQGCPPGTDVAAKLTKRVAEEKILCEVMCCCSTATGTGARQGCVADTLDAADGGLGFQSHYKAEISYDMTKVPPAPIMHRGYPPTMRSTNWQYRARTGIPGYQAGTGMVRRPDIVIVRDPTRPPTQDNIERVVEMKFVGDGWGDGQELAYQRIAGPNEMTPMTEMGCLCGEREPVRAPQPVPVPSPVPAPQRDSGPSWTDYALVGLAGLALAAAVISPFEGPAGDILAAGALTTALGNL